MTRSDILLEAGTNELEMLLFELPGAVYGVNVAKVREVILLQVPTPVPESKAIVEGVLNLRGKVVPIISLRKYFDLGETANVDDERIIVMEFSDVCVGFIVDSVDKIYRVSWGTLSPVPDEAVMRGAAFTAIAQIDDRIVLVVDFERIMIELSGDGFGKPADTVAEKADRAQYHVLIADDSHTIRQLIEGYMTAAGYRVTGVSNGEDAWNEIQKRQQSGERQFDLLVSDIEMPRMDGLFLTRKVKEDSNLSNMPVVLFSSLITPSNLKKGEAVGVDVQLSKPCVHQIPQIADQLIAQKNGKPKTSAVPV